MTRILFPLVLSVALLVLSALTFFYMAHQWRELEAEQEHIGVILQEGREILSGLQDAETGQRGFLITGREEYLEPFQAARKTFDQHFSKLYDLLSGDPAWKGRLDRLHDLKDKKFAELDHTIAIRHESNFAAAQQIVLEGEGKQYMDGMRVILGELFTEERDRRTEINQHLIKALTTAVTAFFVLVVTVSSTIAFGYGITARTLKENSALADFLEHEATHDLLTKLPNRRYMLDFLDRSLAQSKRYGSAVSVFFMDLDGFKQVNDKCGHQAGDEVLINVAKRFGAIRRETDFLARLGGDEFALVVSPSPDDPDELQAMAQRYIDALLPPMVFGGEEYPIGASIGVATYPRHANTTQALMDEADKAMYQAKRCGKNRSCIAADTHLCETCDDRVV